MAETEQSLPACTVHDWECIAEENFGEMDYSSYGGGVEPYVIRTYRCRKCGALRKEGSGDFNGDPSSLLEITEEEQAAAVRALTEGQKKRDGTEAERKKLPWGKIVLVLFLAFVLFVCFVFYMAERDQNTRRAAGALRPVQIQRISTNRNERI